MTEKDLISDGTYTPSYDEIVMYFNEPAKSWWQDICSFIKQSYNASPKIAYSKCSAKPGWNVKYQKSGKSLCTLYPERDSFVALIVILTELVPAIEALSNELEQEIVEQVRRVKPLNGTLWLMIQIKNETALNSIKQLLLLKHGTAKNSN